MNNEPVALTQVEIMNALTLGIPLYTHPVKELHLSLQKSKQTGELLAVTYTDDEHRIVEVLWQRPPVKEQDTDCQYCKQGCIRCDARKQLTDEEIEALEKTASGNYVLVPSDKLAEQQAEIEALGDMLIEEGIGVCQKYIDERIEKLRKASEK